MGEIVARAILFATFCTALALGVISLSSYGVPSSASTSKAWYSAAAPTNAIQGHAASITQIFNDGHGH